MQTDDDSLFNELPAILAANVATLMKRHPALQSEAALGSASDLDPALVRSILRAQANPTTAEIEQLAEAFEIESWLLLFPGFDPDNAAQRQSLYGPGSSH